MKHLVSKGPKYSVGVQYSVNREKISKDVASPNPPSKKKVPAELHTKKVSFIGCKLYFINLFPSLE